MSTNTVTTAEAGAVVRKGRVTKSPTRRAMDRFKHNKAAVVSIFVLAIILLVSICAPLLTHWNPTAQDLMNTDLKPSADHLLGTDQNGFDYFARDIYGGRIDFMIGLIDMLIVMLVSIVLGGIAGFYGGWVDSVVMRICDFMLNFPFILLIIVLQAIIPNSNVWLLILVIAIVGWAAPTRFIRGLFLGVRESEFVLAARMSGAGLWRVIFKHMLPNTIGPIVVQATFMVSAYIGLEAGLAIIGFGVPPTEPSWGNVLNQAQDYFTLKTEPWAWIPPAALLTITILCINFIGDGLRDAFDPSFEK